MSELNKIISNTKKIPLRGYGLDMGGVENIARWIEHEKRQLIKRAKLVGRVGGMCVAAFGVGYATGYYIEKSYKKTSHEKSNVKTFISTVQFLGASMRGTGYKNQEIAIDKYGNIMTREVKGAHAPNFIWSYYRKKINLCKDIYNDFSRSIENSHNQPYPYTSALFSKYKPANCRQDAPTLEGRSFYIHFSRLYKTDVLFREVCEKIGGSPIKTMQDIREWDRKRSRDYANTLIKAAKSSYIFGTGRYQGQVIDKVTGSKSWAY